MALPTVSVIIPGRNRPAFLREAILSAINQTLPPMEILVVDNGSDPDVREAIVRLASLYDCVRFIALSRNHGAGHARNVGLEAARGDWILFLDDDDILFSDFLERCFEALAREDGAQMAVGRALRFQDGQSTICPRDLISGFNLRAFQKDPVSARLTQGVAMGSCLMSRKAIGACRFSTRLCLGEDMLFWLDVFLRAAGPPALAAHAFVAIRQHPKQTTATKLQADGTPKLSITPIIPLVLKALERADPWLAFCVRVLALYRGGRAWHDSELLRLLVGRPDFAARIFCTRAGRRLAQAGVWPWWRPTRVAVPLPVGVQSSRPSLLFICGVVPLPSGAGACMRPYHQLMALARTYSMHLLLVLNNPGEARIPTSLRGLCQDIEIMPRTRHTGWSYRLWWRWRRWRGDALAGELACPEFLRKTRAWGRSEPFQRIHVFRLYLSPLAQALMRRFPSTPTSLDMDDMESKTRLSMAAVHHYRGERQLALFCLREARLYQRLEDNFLPRVQKIFVASALDQATLARRFPGTPVGVLPNVVLLPSRLARRPARPVAEPRLDLSMLFVGSLRYFPNADALRHFAEDLAPALDALGVAWQLRVVGAPPRLPWGRPARGDNRWTWAGWVEDLGPEYAAADVVVAPIRCGGGTRIKVLEAFAHQVPVVATSMALEGLPVEHGIHCLVADVPSAFAQACARLGQEPALGRALAARAAELVRTGFTPEALDSLLREEGAGQQVEGGVHLPNVGFGHEALVEAGEVAAVAGPPEVAP
ncbi:MAG: glycosyltransferase [Verrucomicrobia bacterium]|nr:glycosyltransferase [Verrucomicrobiota bacterium]